MRQLKGLTFTQLKLLPKFLEKIKVLRICALSFRSRFSSILPTGDIFLPNFFIRVLKNIHSKMSVCELFSHFRFKRGFRDCLLPVNMRVSNYLITIINFLLGGLANIYVLREKKLSRIYNELLNRGRLC